MSLLLAHIACVEELASVERTLVGLELSAQRLTLVVVLAATLLSPAGVPTFADSLAFAFSFVLVLAALCRTPGSVVEPVVLPGSDPILFLSAGRGSCLESAIPLARGGWRGRGDNEKLLEEADILHDLVGGSCESLVLSHVHAKSPTGCIPC